MKNANAQAAPSARSVGSGAIPRSITSLHAVSSGASGLQQQQELVAVRHLGGEVEDRRPVQPHPQRVGEEVLEVAEVDLAGRHEHRHARGQHAEQREHGDQPQQLRADRQVGDEVDRQEDHDRRQEALERGDHRRAGQQQARERGVEDQAAAADDRPHRLADRVGHEVVGEQRRHQVGEELDAAGARPQDVDQHEVHAGQQQRVEDQPELPEQRVVVLRAQVGPRQLERELAPPPQLAHVRAERRQADAVRLVDVPHGRELVGALVLLGIGDGGGQGQGEASR